MQSTPNSSRRKGVTLVLLVLFLFGTAEAQEVQKAQEDAKILVGEGLRLYGEGSKESREKAIGKFEQALPLYRTAGDRKGEAIILTYIGAVYRDLDEKQKAL